MILLLDNEEVSVKGVYDSETRTLTYLYTVRENSLQRAIIFDSLDLSGISDILGNKLSVNADDIVIRATIDRSNPVVENITIDSNNTNNSLYATKDDVLTFTATLSEGVSGNVPTLKIKIGNATIELSGELESNDKIIYTHLVNSSNKGLVSFVSLSGGDLKDSAHNNLNLTYLDGLDKAITVINSGYVLTINKSIPCSLKVEW